MPKELNELNEKIKEDKAALRSAVDAKDAAKAEALVRSIKESTLKRDVLQAETDKAVDDAPFEQRGNASYEKIVEKTEDIYGVRSGVSAYDSGVHAVISRSSEIAEKNEAIIRTVLSVGDNQSVGNALKKNYIMNIKSRMYDARPLLNLVDRRPIFGNTAVPILGGKFEEARRVGEKPATNDHAKGLNLEYLKLELKPKELISNFAITTSLLRNTDFNVILNEIALKAADTMGSKLEDEILNGSENGCQGIIPALVASGRTIETENSGAISLNDFVNLESEIRPVHNSGLVYVTSRKGWAAYKKLFNDRSVSPDINTTEIRAGFRGVINGIPVVISEKMSNDVTVAGTVSFILGNIRNTYVLGDQMLPTLETSNARRLEDREVDYTYVEANDGGVKVDLANEQSAVALTIKA